MHARMKNVRNFVLDNDYYYMPNVCIVVQKSLLPFWLLRMRDIFHFCKFIFCECLLEIHHSNGEINEQRWILQNQSLETIFALFIAKQGMTIIIIIPLHWYERDDDNTDDLARSFLIFCLLARCNHAITVFQRVLNSRN